jgi:WD40 repeat protein/serine/threonine protein kinase
VRTSQPQVTVKNATLCPFCDRELSDHEVLRGNCPGCERELADANETFDMPAEFEDMWSEAEPADDNVSFVPEDECEVGTSGRPVVKAHSLAEPGDVSPLPADFELLEQLDKGGMGVVYKARQTSIDRTIVIKMLKSEKARSRSARAKFLAEAVVTGDLEHPNIVPVYDLGAGDDGKLFYAMKQVQGVAWNKVIRERSRPENLETLMRVADATAYAHSKGVIHRDLKPENVMLGDYGEVLVMDWGLALSVAPGGRAQDLVAAGGVGGTPAYMAPEMARGAIGLIGFASDVYLLGAILFEIVTGKPPHPGKTVQDLLKAATENRIQAEDNDDRLLVVARKALATRPADRYPSVKALQEAIRDYQSHAESILLDQHARHDLERAKETADYDTFAQALYGFREASSLWDANESAREGEAETRMAYARCAANRGDFDLAAGLLLLRIPEHKEFYKQIDDARDLRNDEARRRQMVLRVVRGLAVIVILVLAGAAFVIHRGQQRAVAAEQIARSEQTKAEAAHDAEVVERERAESALQDADKARKDAESSLQAAEDARKVAESALSSAESARQAEAEQRRKAEEALARAESARKAEAEQRLAAEAARQTAVREQKAAEEARLIAEAEREKALAAIRERETAEREAETARSDLAAQRTVAESARRLAEDAERRSEVVRYVGGLQAAEGKLNQLAFHEAAKLLDACPESMRHWEWGRLRHLSKLNYRVLRGHTAPIRTLATNADGSVIATGGQDRALRLWSAKGGLLRTLEGHERGIRGLAFVQGDSRILSIDDSGATLLWDLRGGEPARVSTGENTAMARVHLSDDGERAYLGGLMRNLNTGLRLMQLDDKAITSVAFLPDPTLVFAGGSDGTARLWKSVDRLTTVPLNIGPGAASVPDNLDNLASVPVGESIVEFAGHTGPIVAVDVAENGSLLLSASVDATARVWTPEGKLVATLKGHPAPLSAAVMVPDGRRVLTGDSSGVTKLWDLHLGRELLSLQPHKGAVRALKVAADGRMITAGDDHQAIIWDPLQSRRPLRLDGHKGPVRTACFTPDGSQLATGGEDGDIRVWEAASGAAVKLLKGHGGPVYALYCPSAIRMLSAGYDGRVILWDLAAGKALRIVPHPHRTVAHLDIDDAGGIRLANSASGLRIRYLEEGMEVPGTQPPIHSPDGRLSASAGERDVQVWDIHAGREIARCSGHSQAVTAVAFSPDSRRLVTASKDESVKLWSAETGVELITLSGHGAVVRDLAFSANGRAIVGCGNDGSAIIWHADAW